MHHVRFSNSCLKISFNLLGSRFYVASLKCRVNVNEMPTNISGTLRQENEKVPQTFTFRGTSIILPTRVPEKNLPPTYNDAVGIFNLPPEYNLTNTSS